MPDGRRAPSPRRALIAPEPEPAARVGGSVPCTTTSTRGSGCGSGSPGWAPAGPQTPALDPLFRIVRANHPKADLHADRAGVPDRGAASTRVRLRKSGDAYITHPLAVTTILAELGMNEPTLCAALLHDTVEDTDVHAAAS